MLLEPLDVNAIGRGIVASVTPFMVNVDPDYIPITASFYFLFVTSKTKTRSLVPVPLSPGVRTFWSLAF